MGINIFKKINPDQYKGNKRLVFLIVPFIQIILCLNSLEPFLFWGLHRFAIDFAILIILCIAGFYLLRIYFAIAKKWQMWLMYGFVTLITIQIGAGFMYKFYRPAREYFNDTEEFVIKQFIAGKDSLPSKFDVLTDNDSIMVIGKKINIRAYDYSSNGNNYDLSAEERINGKAEYLNSLYKEPHDFRLYKELITSKSVMDDCFYDFWCWQYPNHLVYIYIKDCDCLDTDKKKEHCYLDFFTWFHRGGDRFKPILRELFEGRLDDRYRNFYKFFQKLVNPTYVRNDLANDPYFLIYQGKYKEAREGLKDLPPARREFCEKKLEALGY